MNSILMMHSQYTVPWNLPVVIKFVKRAWYICYSIGPFPSQWKRVFDVSGLVKWDGESSGLHHPCSLPNALDVGSKGSKENREIRVESNFHYILTFTNIEWVVFCNFRKSSILGRLVKIWTALFPLSFHYPNSFPRVQFYTSLAPYCTTFMEVNTGSSIPESIGQQLRSATELLFREIENLTLERVIPLSYLLSKCWRLPDTYTSHCRWLVFGIGNCVWCVSGRGGLDSSNRG